MLQSESGTQNLLYNLSEDKLSSEWNFLHPAPNTPGQPAHPPWETYLWSDLASTDDPSFTDDEKATPPHGETFPSPEHVFMKSCKRTLNARSFPLYHIAFT